MTGLTGPIVDLTQVPFAPGSSPAYRGQLVDQNGNPVGAGALSTFTLSIVDTVTGAIVNGVQDASILNAGRGTVDSQGNAVVTLLAADTALLVATHTKEFRSLILHWTWNAGVGSGWREVRFALEALAGS